MPWLIGADQRRLDDHHPADLPAVGADQPQQRQLAPALEDQREQRAGHAEHRDDDGDELQRVGDREGAVEDAQDLGAQRPVGVDEDAMPLVELRSRSSRARLGIGAWLADRRVRPSAAARRSTARTCARSMTTTPRSLA